MSYDPDRSVRTLLESAVPRETVPAPLAAEIRSIGRRRQRRTQAFAAVVAVAAVSAASVVGVQVMNASPAPTPGPFASSGPQSPTSTPSPIESTRGTDLIGLVGTRWIPNLIDSGITTTQAFPGDSGPYPRTLMTFGKDHVLTLYYSEGTKHWTVTGTWQVQGRTPDLSVQSAGAITLHITAPPDATDTLNFLINRAQLSVAYAMWNIGGDSTFSGLRMLPYSAANVNMLALDQVRAASVLPSSYPGA
jgi:hypothetical protein